MRRLRTFLCLESADRRLLVKAVVLVAAIRLGLWLIPFRSLRRLVTGVSGAPDKSRRSSADRLVWAIATAGRYIPKTTCLTQALAAQALLARHGHRSRLHIGVARGGSGRLEAHAWVESAGKVVIGGSEAECYTPLLALEAGGV